MSYGSRTGLNRARSVSAGPFRDTVRGLCVTYRQRKLAGILRKLAGQVRLDTKDRNMEISRRNLLIASAAALPGRFFGASATEERNGLWYQRLRRCAQHNLSEYDPKILEIEPW